MDISPGACFLLPMHPAFSQNNSLISNTVNLIIVGRNYFPQTPAGPGMVALLLCNQRDRQNGFNPSKSGCGKC